MASALARYRVNPPGPEPRRLSGQRTRGSGRSPARVVLLLCRSGKTRHSLSPVLTRREHVPQKGHLHREAPVAHAAKNSLASGTLQVPPFMARLGFTPVRAARRREAPDLIVARQSRWMLPVRRLWKCHAASGVHPTRRYSRALMTRARNSRSPSQDDPFKVWLETRDS